MLSKVYLKTFLVSKYNFTYQFVESEILQKSGTGVWKW